MLLHDLTTDRKLFLQFWIVRSKKITTRSFHGKENITTFDIQTLQGLFWKDKAGGSADGSEFEFHGAPIPIYIIMQLTCCQGDAKQLE